MAALLIQQSSAGVVADHVPAPCPPDTYLHIFLWCCQSTLAQVSLQYHTCRAGSPIRPCQPAN